MERTYVISQKRSIREVSKAIDRLLFGDLRSIISISLILQWPYKDRISKITIMVMFDTHIIYIHLIKKIKLIINIYYIFELFFAKKVFIHFII